MGRMIDKEVLEKYIIHDGCEKGCGYIDERDLKYIPTVEAIPKAYYEARLKENNELINDLEELRTMINKFAESYETRLKADLKAILVELQLEIEEWSIPENAQNKNRMVYMKRVDELIQQKINALKAEKGEEDDK